MKFFTRRKKSGTSLAVSIVVHAAVIVALVNIVFRYPLGQLMGITKPDVTPERIEYVKIEPRGAASSTGATQREQPSAAPAPLITPSLTPNAVLTPITADSVPTRAAGATGSGFGVSNSELATGVVPRQPDDRIELEPGPMVRQPRSVAQEIDSAVSIAIGIYNDSMTALASRKQPTDWTFNGKGGKYGMDPQNIYLGKYKIPTALLALLPLNMSGPQSPIEMRSASYIRRDIMESAQHAITEEEFKQSVKRIRERKEREKRQAEKAAAKPLP